MFKHSIKESLVWIKDSVALFRKKPAMCMLVALSYVFLFIVIPAIQGMPTLLKLMIMLAWPAYMVLAITFFLELDKNQPFQLATLLKHIQPYIAKLVLLGAICLLYGVLVSGFTSGDLNNLNDMIKAGDQNEAIATKVLPLMLKVLLLLAPLLMATWFAPMLIVHHQFSVFRAIKSSIAGSLYSALSLGFAWLFLTLAFSVAMMFIGVLVGIVSAISQPFALVLASLTLLNCFLVATAMMLAFQYVSYRDVFAKKFANLAKVDISV